MMGEWRGWRGMRGLAGDDVRVHAEGGGVGMQSGKFAGDTGYKDLQNEKDFARHERLDRREEVRVILQTRKIFCKK